MTPAWAPLTGTPPRPATWTSTVAPGPIRTPPPSPVRLSKMRAGTTGSKRPAPPPVSEYQPATSARRWRVPPGLYAVTRPLTPTFTTTRLDTVSAGPKLRLDVGGRAAP